MRRATVLLDKLTTVLAKLSTPNAILKGPMVLTAEITELNQSAEKVSSEPLTWLNVK